ncbi:Ger(x)C family spore germination protein [Gorillibacterium sp. sgz500922]|uniref:Ger(x)C family spore germination protein n=1 Tax=Gorillibacterium sp. sgz500922 TaxID=3446694 RepID=UPI003F68218C
MTMFRRRTLVFLVLAAILFWIPGCSFQDIDKRFFVVAVGLDHRNDPAKPYRVSLKLAIPSSHIEPGQARKFQLLTEDAASIADAVSLLTSRVDKHLDFSHTKVFILGEPLLKKNVQEALDWLIRRQEVQGIAFLAAGEPDAESILKTSPPSERLPSNSLNLIFGREGNNSAYIMPMTVADFYRRSLEVGLTPYLPLVIPSQETYVVNKVALLEQNKIRLILEPKETLFLNQLTRKRMERQYSFQNGDEHYMLDLRRFGYSYTFRQGVDGRLIHAAKLHVSLFIEQSTGGGNTQDWPRIEKLTARHLTSDYLNLMHKIQASGTDPLGFGLRYRAVHHGGDRDYAEWAKKYPEMEFTVEAKVHVLGAGVVK